RALPQDNRARPPGIWNGQLGGRAARGALRSSMDPALLPREGEEGGGALPKRGSSSTGGRARRAGREEAVIEAGRPRLSWKERITVLGLTLAGRFLVAGGRAEPRGGEGPLVTEAIARWRKAGLFSAPGDGDDTGDRRRW